MLKKKLDIIIAGHHHKPAFSPELILLPSFQFGDDEARSERGGLIIVERGSDCSSCWWAGNLQRGLLYYKLCFLDH